MKKLITLLKAGRVKAARRTLEGYDIQVNDKELERLRQAALTVKPRRKKARRVKELKLD